ncbi:glycosyltransferase involved in cell wall biosynthesis [Paenibacillus shirakamiensis]|uniref:Glycosyltransferase involved in cell wall biosynthesis n=1 Tax=Paenibacillus shirakamiensis TaxID=1265935 RepID=A0ABS4JDV3_9BACL|nr:glycosyltransferase [Paenibacillus shirakamiensis]MBP1999896.1 glycosyltransferase involved in cell wall biosynthesis [Paenibacillus shirakamiensis]
MSRILIGSPVYQRPPILELFLNSLHRLESRGIDVDYLFVDDNVDTESSKLLQDFFHTHQPNCHPLIEGSKQEYYISNDITHFWNSSLVAKVALFKNKILDLAHRLEYDAVFLVDSDLILHPSTLVQLVESEKDIVSEIFWTRWTPESSLLPQVWLNDEYKLYAQAQGEQITFEEQQMREQQFLSTLKQPGLYEVGGLGACTLISLKALQLGVNFSPIPNVTFWGEDRHFCIRAAVLGCGLYVDTHYPAQHLYREEDIHRAQAELKSRIFPPSALLTKVTLSMTVFNEKGGKLADVLRSYRDIIDEAVIIDDGSTDGSGELCQEILGDIPLTLVRNEHASFHNEISLRKQQWRATIATSPEWILSMDADEMFEPAFKEGIRTLLRGTHVDAVCFRLYDMWSETHYRNDDFWKAHEFYRPFLVRYNPYFTYTWNDQSLHCGRFPNNVLGLSHILSSYRVQHWGWYTPEIRTSKYARYKKLDPEAQYGWMEQYESILDPFPVLEAWRSED